MRDSSLEVYLVIILDIGEPTASDGCLGISFRGEKSEQEGGQRDEESRGDFGRGSGAVRAVGVDCRNGVCCPRSHCFFLFNYKGCEVLGRGYKHGHEKKQEVCVLRGRQGHQQHQGE